jgi:hypothetical protein
VNEARLAADLGELAVDYSDAQLKDLRIGTLLTIGTMTASLVVGPSIVMTVSGGPTVFGVSLLLLRAGWLPDRIRQQPVGYPFDLALRTAMTERRAMPTLAVPPSDRPRGGW